MKKERERYYIYIYIHIYKDQEIEDLSKGKSQVGPGATAATKMDNQDHPRQGGGAPRRHSHA